MKLSDIVTFRQDLLFNGAVQLSWFEEDPDQAEKAAGHFVFHGPDYHGVAGGKGAGGEQPLVDTANFTLDILERLRGGREGDPFLLGIAGYGTGKSHLGVTLASLLSSPHSRVSSRILSNLFRADEGAGERAAELLLSAQGSQPHLVVALNGMQDFDLGGEIVRQVMLRLDQAGVDTSALDNLKPRFAVARQFTLSFYDSLREDFEYLFGRGCSRDAVLEGLKCQQEEVFRKVSQVYQQKMGTPIQAAGQEALQDFLRVAAREYCGEGRPFAGIFIIFDEFGRYLEFAAQKPHIAGPAGLQQLFEGVQNNRRDIFLLCFIQDELRAYISRLAPEYQGDLGRYLGRYDSVRKVRLSSNLETLLANLLEKKDEVGLEKQLAGVKEKPARLQATLLRWFPPMEEHALWKDRKRFRQVICKGCWPLHPLSTWVFYWLSSVGKSLQQRSAFYLLADVYRGLEEAGFKPGETIVPAQLCTPGMLSEFQLAGEYDYQDTGALAYQAVLDKYQYSLSPGEKTLLKGVLVSSRLGYRVGSREECRELLAMFSGLGGEEVAEAVRSLEQEYGALAWDQAARKYEIVGEAVPRAAFRNYLKSLERKVDSRQRGELFCQKFPGWAGQETYETGCRETFDSTTLEWHYRLCYSSVSRLDQDLEEAFRNWREAVQVDEAKGQLVYVYVGPESSPAAVEESVRETLGTHKKRQGLYPYQGAPVGVQLLYDREGALGQKMVNYWHLKEAMGERQREKYANFIPEETGRVEEEMWALFQDLQEEGHLFFAAGQEIPGGPVKERLEKVFQVVYPRCLPFPFDKFHTPRGNAARDSQTFIKEMFLGNLDRDWIAAQAAQVRDRANRVLVESWGALAEDGSLRLRPLHKTIKEMFQDLEERLEQGKGDPAGEGRPGGASPGEGAGEGRPARYSRGNGTSPGEGTAPGGGGTSGDTGGESGEGRGPGSGSGNWAGSSRGDTGDTWEAAAPVSLGEVFRAWCAPPYGCNLASAGLLLALFAGSRREELDLVLDREITSVEKWLQVAIPKNFLEVEVLDRTTLARVSGETLSEWESLLDEWEAEETLPGKVAYREKGKALSARLQVPRQLYYKYENLKNLAGLARQEVHRVGAVLQGAREAVKGGAEGQDAAPLCRGAAAMEKVYRQLTSRPGQWPREQVEDLKVQLDQAVYLAREFFPPWLEGQEVQEPGELTAFQEALARVREDLETLGLPGEISLLEERAAKVTGKVRLVEEAQKVIQGIRALLEKRQAPPSTPVYALKDLQGEIRQYQAELDRLEGAGCPLVEEIKEARGMLQERQETCRFRLASYQERLDRLKNIEDVSEITQIEGWQNEISSLLTAYENQEEDQLLYTVQKQLRLLAKHLDSLDDRDLDDIKFEIRCQAIRAESQQFYLFNHPPANSEIIYNRLVERAREKRKVMARQWMQENVPEERAIEGFTGDKANRYSNLLKNPPGLLSPGQVQEVSRALRACERRLDELEVKGLLSKFQAMPRRNKKVFMQEAQKVLEQSGQAGPGEEGEEE